MIRAEPNLRIFWPASRNQETNSLDEGEGQGETDERYDGRTAFALKPKQQSGEENDDPDSYRRTEIVGPTHREVKFGILLDRHARKMRINTPVERLNLVHRRNRSNSPIFFGTIDTD